MEQRRAVVATKIWARSIEEFGPDEHAEVERLTASL
jgi:hypothetical protein